MSDKAFEIRFNALRSAIYHTTRRSAFEGANRFANFVVVASGTAAVADLGRFVGLADGDSRIYFAAIAALAGLVQLVFDLPGLAREHEFLQRQFYEVVAEVAECLKPSSELIGRWEAKLNRLYGEEKPPMRALDAIAWNAAAASLGRTKRINIRWWHSFLRHIYPFNETDFSRYATP